MSSRIPPEVASLLRLRVQALRREADTLYGSQSSEVKALHLNQLADELLAKALAVFRGRHPDVALEDLRSMESDLAGFLHGLLGD